MQRPFAEEFSSSSRPRGTRGWCLGCPELAGSLARQSARRIATTPYAVRMVRTQSTQRLALGTTAPDFELVDTEGETIRLGDFAGRPLLVAFICPHCPFVVHIRAGFAQFAREYAAKGLAIVAINSNDVTLYPADSPAKMREEARAAGYAFPYLFDATQSVAKAYCAACTPDFFLFDAAHALVYRGRFDAARPEQSTPVTGSDLRAAADAVLAGQRYDGPQHGSLGCNIKWMPGNEPEWFAPAGVQRS